MSIKSPLGYTPKIAILDLNEGQANQGMRCIREIVRDFSIDHRIPFHIQEFDVRAKNQVPDYREFDLYISSGGPGSPYDGEGKDWEERYFGLINNIWEHNKKNKSKKFLFLICHSFQMACRFFRIGEVVRRKSQAFGIFPIHKTINGESEPLFEYLSDPFYGVDSRDWQVIQPDFKVINKIGAKIVAIEKDRPHVPLERCIMAMRFSPEIFGTQFHPEADAIGMYNYLMTDEKREMIIQNHGLEKYQAMLNEVLDPSKLELTQRQIIPNFMKAALMSPVGAIS